MGLPVVPALCNNQMNWNNLAAGTLELKIQVKIRNVVSGFQELTLLSGVICKHRIIYDKLHDLKAYQ